MRAAIGTGKSLGIEPTTARLAYVTESPVSAVEPAKPAKSRVARGGVNALVLDAEYRQALAMMRSLSRHGLRVGALACLSQVDDALAFRSRWCELRAVVPDFAADPKAYGDAVLAVLDEHPVDVVMPCHDGSIETLRGRRAELERRTAVPLASEKALDIAASKTQTLALAEQLGIAVPVGVTLTDYRDLQAALNHTGYPAVIKPVKSWVARNGVGSRLGCEVVSSLSDAQQKVQAMEAAGADVVIQPWLPGRRDAVTLFYARGRMWGTFVQTSYRELPMLGGASVLCESLPRLPDLTEPAERLVRAMALEGCSMVEFRRDRQGRPVLMEVNGRMPGSVSLAISCGVDFPQLLYAWALGRPLQEVSSYRVGRRLRWLGGDLWNLRAAFGSAGHPEAEGWRQAVATFFLDFVRRSSAIDVVDRDDFLPAIIELRQTLARPALRRIKELLTRVPRTKR